MDASVNFIFQGHSYIANVYFDLANPPYYMFINLKDKRLINDFGNNIHIKSEGEEVLTSIDDYPELQALKTAIFEAIKHDPFFKAEKIKTEHKRDSLKGSVREDLQEH